MFAYDTTRNITQNSLNVRELTPGLYIVELSQDNKRSVQKFLKF